MFPSGELKEKFRPQLDAETPEQWRVRIHRAISWLARSEQEHEDTDARFIFQWIALNAVYAQAFTDTTERERARRFIDTLVALDVQGRLHDVLFSQFSGPIRTLLDNHFVFEPFWIALRDHDSSDGWERSFRASRKVALTAVMNGDTATVLSVVFDRLYVLRNQLVHGGATWNSRVNRNQLKDAVAILGALVPVVIAVMLEHPDADFGEVLYPVV